MKSQGFDSFDLISIIGFLSAYDLGCDKGGVCEGAALWLQKFSLKRAATSALNAHIAEGS